MTKNCVCEIYNDLLRYFPLRIRETGNCNNGFIDIIRVLKVKSILKIILKHFSIKNNNITNKCNSQIFSNSK